jgi:hypothetical protein
MPTDNYSPDFNKAFNIIEKFIAEASHVERIGKLKFMVHYLWLWCDNSECSFKLQEVELKLKHIYELEIEK